MRILHSGDWHIGPQKGPEENGINLRAQDTIDCLEYLVEVAEEKLPDLVVISGDIFHTAETWQGRSHKEVLQVRGIILRLSEIAGEVIIMRGTPNHDSEEGFKELIAHFEFVPNVKVVTTPQVLEGRNAYIVAIPGFSVGEFRAKFPGFSKEEENQIFTDELGKMVTGLKALCGSNKPTILMSHYTVPGCNMESGQTQFLKQFEPVITQEALLAADYDLVALGHIHRPQKVMDRVFYCGAINSLNFNDEGQERGFWIHELDKNVIDYEEDNYSLESYFIKTPYREFKTIRWGINDVQQAITSPEILYKKFVQDEVSEKIVRIIYNCTSEQKKALNTAVIEKSLYEAGAFWKADIIMDNVEDINKTKFSKFDDPETNLIMYLKEKEVEEVKIPHIVEKARPIISRALANSAVSEIFGTFIPVEISVKNYRNYVEQSFSFEEISFCTINGSNGSGKSSLFMDAIMDCLYEKPREGEKTGWIRSEEKARSGAISFTFKLGDKTFRVVRTRAKSGRPTLNLAELVDGEWLDRSKDKIDGTQEEIIRVLGMDSLTFKACVLIMQDQYGLFLEASKKERIAVLSNLLGLGIYKIMEEHAKNAALEIKREHTKKKTSIDLHAQTILGYGAPEQDLQRIEEVLAKLRIEVDSLTKQKEDKSIILRMQSEAEERRQKVLININTLEGKKVMAEQNINVLGSTIYTCSTALNSEIETNEKVERYNFLSKLERELSEAATIYNSKVVELSGLHTQILKETLSIDDLKLQLNIKATGLESLKASESDDYEVKERVAEYEEKKCSLDVAYEEERKYRSLEQKLSDSKFERSSIVSKFLTKKKHIELTESGYKQKAELLENVDCVDIENAKCGFLSDAITAKKALDNFPAMLLQLEEDKTNELIPIEEKINSIEDEIKEMNFDLGKVNALQTSCECLKVFVSKLEEINQRQNQISLIEASIEHLQSNIVEAEKRLLEVKIKASEIEKSLSTNKETAQQHKNVTDEIQQLLIYVEKAKTYPVIKERKANAEKQQADEVLRLSELEQELLNVQNELQTMGGSTLDIEQLKRDLSFIDTKLEEVNNDVKTYQITTGTIQQKIDEKKRLMKEIKVLQNEQYELSKELADLEILKAAFSQDGIPHQIIRSLVPKLTHISSSILGQMTGGKMGIEFKTEKSVGTQGKEEVTLDIFIEEQGKPALPYMSKSGGEKVKASLSVILALAEIKSSSAGIQLGMLFIDEPPFLDSDGIQAYCDALETIQNRYPNLKIMAITHDPTMKARFPQSLDVIKTDEGSKVIYE